MKVSEQVLECIYYNKEILRNKPVSSSVKLFAIITIGIIRKIIAQPDIITKNLLSINH